MLHTAKRKENENSAGARYILILHILHGMRVGVLRVTLSYTGVGARTRLCIPDFTRLCIPHFPRLCIPLFHADDDDDDDEDDEDEDDDDDDDDDDGVPGAAIPIAKRPESFPSLKTDPFLP